MNGADPQRWSAYAEGWSRWWAGIAVPAWREVAAAAGIGPGVRVLDVGCGSGEFLAFAGGLGARLAGVDPAPGMRTLARAHAPQADVREGAAEALPWDDGTFDVVTAWNALQFAADADDALAEFARVARPAGTVAVANWAEAARNDLDVVERAVAAAAGETVPPDGDERLPGGLEALLGDNGLDVTASGLTECPWLLPDEDTLRRALLHGEDPEVLAATAPALLAAARPFRGADGGYRLVNHFRWAVARTR